MMTSSGSGAYGVGGSLSSSNLSPLAPPFKVDKSFSKPNSTHPSVNFIDRPVYGSCFDPAPGQFWSSSTSSSSGLQCGVTESVVNNTNSSSSPYMYWYRDSQSNTSRAGMYYGSGNGVTPFDPFAYDPFPNNMPSNANEVAKSYSVPCVPSAPQEDGYLCLGVDTEPGYDLLSYSGSAHISECVPTQVDHAHAMPGDGGYKSKWGSFWSALSEDEHGKWTDYVQGCASKDLNTSIFSSNKSPVFVDGTNKSQPFVDINVLPFVDGSSSNYIFDDVSNQSHLKKGASLTQDSGLHVQASTVKDNCFDIFGGACSLSCLDIGQQGCKPLSECSKKKTSASVSKETPQLQEPVLKSISSFCGSQKGNVLSPEGHFREPGFFMFGCASNTSTFPKSITELPYGGTISPVGSTPSAVKRNSMGLDAADQSNTTGGYNFTYQMESQMLLGSKRHSSIRIRKPSSMSTVASSCQLGEIGDSRLENKVSSEQMKISPQLPHQLSLHGLNIEDSDVEAVYSVEKNSAGSDSHNPAEDSPCWKGASSNRLSPFGHSENVDSDALVKKIHNCKSMSSQDLQNSSVVSDAFGSKDFSSRKVNETTSFEKPPVNDCALNSNKDCGSANPSRFDLNTSDGFQFAEDCYASLVECNMLNKSKADISEALPSEECENRTPVAEESLSGLPSSIHNNVSDLLPGNKASLKSDGEDSNSRIDINVLLRTMINLSETLRCYCFSNRAQVSEKQSLAVKQILCNLNASMLLMSGQTIATTVLSQPDKLFLKEFPVVEMVNDTEALAASLKLGGTTEDFSEYISSSSKDDENSFQDVNMMEAVKKLISEDFQEEDVDQQKLLYKNLWLEAEASLCLMTARARFLRMKTEMKRDHDGIKEKDNPTSPNIPVDIHKDIELGNDNLHSPHLGEYLKPTTTSHIKVFHDPKSQVGRVFSESERSTSPKNETSVSSLYVSGTKENPCSTSHANDVDTRVMARYQVLKNRVGGPNTLNYESNQPSGEHKCPSSSFDVGNTSPASSTNIKSNDLQISDFGAYQILKGRDDTSSCLNFEGQQLPGDENYLPGNEFTNGDKSLQDSQMSNSLGVTAESEASIMARFRLIQSRKDHSNFLINDSAPAQASAVVFEDGTTDMDEYMTSFGPYPQLPNDEDVNNFDIGANEQAFDPILKTSRMSSVILEGWYANNCSSSDWQHISSCDV